jgi:hypothetical protein
MGTGEGTSSLAALRDEWYKLTFCVVAEMAA